MSRLTEKYNLQGPSAKYVEMSEAMAKASIKAVTHKHGTPEWWAWHGWRKRNGLSVAFMESRPTFGVPDDMPPTGSLDTALMEAQASVNRAKQRKSLAS